jgi:hypothetical protein
MPSLTLLSSPERPAATYHSRTLRDGASPTHPLRLLSQSLDIRCALSKCTLFLHHALIAGN